MEENLQLEIMDQKEQSGEYITFVDTDDYVEKTWAEKLYNAAKSNDADLAICGFERIDMQTNKVVATNMNKFGNIVKNVVPDDDFVVFINPAPWNKVYRREKIKDLCFLPFRGFNDTMFLVSSLTKIEKIAFIPEILYHYFLRYNSQIHTVNEEDVNNLKKYLLEVKQLYINSKKYEEYKYILDMMAFIHLGVSVMYRASYDKSINIKEMLKETVKYLDENFETWRNSPFLKFSYSVKKGIKHVGLWLISKMYKWNMQLIFIKIYRFMIDVLKIDIKFQ